MWILCKTFDVNFMLSLRAFEVSLQQMDNHSCVILFGRPLMINVQRLSSLGFGLRDAQASDQSKLTPFMKKYSVK